MLLVGVFGVCVADLLDIVCVLLFECCFGGIISWFGCYLFWLAIVWVTVFMIVFHVLWDAFVVGCCFYMVVLLSWLG